MMIALFVFLWLVTGFASFAYWWTKDDDLTTSDLVAAICGTLMGPIAFLGGWCIHGGNHHGMVHVIFKKRQ